MIRLEHLYLLTGAMFAAFAISHLREADNPARWRSASFWGLYAVILMAGSVLPDLANGLIVLALVGLAVSGLRPSVAHTTSKQEREESAGRLGPWLFAPALLVPMLTIAATLSLREGKLGGWQIIQPGQVTLIALGIAAVLGFGAALLMSRPPGRAMIGEGRRLADSVGWAMLLPQMLAALGGLFAFAGVGEAVAPLITGFIPINGAWSAVIIYCVGMAVFTAIMGNAFAAFPIMTAAIGLPLVIQRFGGDPAAVCAIGMLSGFCGTLTTPMAANYNIVPAAVLELPDRNQVIKTQLPTAFALLAINILLMRFLAFL
ncbi:DUF979 domain-containing protein [Sphingobium phenoxybenzoativorans]|uniref:DUF979 domain-containing protein n=1 Tax=Sphingobium phenoxybenzoativorans TaxID=1592790 RepID=A0A975K8K2_9SPHN|nr:DUF979 domain-containing protein [Sphingobium phenoxybenzoativorans]QUT06796.1 DUF979 domain-containing protein [Sphingobium phenoxybenzoativorans]